MIISSNFDSGNIRCLACDHPSDIRLAIEQDFQSHFYQWFHFRLSGAKDQNCIMHIENAAGAAYTDGFKDYSAVASYDLEHWFRIPTKFENGVLTMEFTPMCNSVSIAYFAPYPFERHRQLVATMQCLPGVSLTRLGATLDGRDLDLLQFGEPAEDKLKCWFIARQHPGETMAEWFIEGLLERLVDRDDAISRSLLERAVFYVVPSMNPDGGYRGHLRVNASGANLNREWKNPSMARSPEVYLVRDHMHANGVDFFLDVHGDEALPCNFIAGAEGIADWNDARQKQQDDFKAAYLRATPDFQTKYGYPIAKTGSSNLAKATDYVGHTFGCLSMTLEMPFKDTYNTPNAEVGWSPNRAKHLGAATLNALHDVLDTLR